MIHGLESLFLSKTIDAFNKSQYFRSLQTFLKTCQLLFPVENTAIFQNKRLHTYLSVVNTQEYRFGIQVTRAILSRHYQNGVDPCACSNSELVDYGA